RRNHGLGERVSGPQRPAEHPGRQPRHPLVGKRRRPVDPLRPRLDDDHRIHHHRVVSRDVLAIYLRAPRLPRRRDLVPGVHRSQQRADAAARALRFPRRPGSLRPHRRPRSVEQHHALELVEQHHRGRHLREHHGAGTATIAATSEAVTGTATSTMIAPGSGAPQPGPSDPIIFQDGFESGDLSSWTQDPSAGRYSLSTAPARVHSGTHSLQALFTPTNGYGLITRWFMPGYDEVFVKFYVMF